MKKYITVIPMQNPDNLKKDVYESDNELLRTDFATCFPVLIPMYNDVQDGETVTLVEVIIDGHDFVGAAAANGAACALVTHEVEADIPLIVVDDTAAALTRLSAS